MLSTEERAWASFLRARAAIECCSLLLLCRLHRVRQIQCLPALCSTAAYCGKPIQHSKSGMEEEAGMRDITPPGSEYQEAGTTGQYDCVIVHYPVSLL